MSDTSIKSRILIVDDEKNIANTLAMIFEIRGHEVKTANSAEEAVEIVDSFEPDVVLSDVIMGKMTGVDLAIYLSKSRPDCRVIFFSGQTATANVLAEANRKGHSPPFGKADSPRQAFRGDLRILVRTIPFPNIPPERELTVAIVISHLRVNDPCVIASY